MSEKDNKAVTTWLFVVCGLIMFMVVFGGYVRLTRSGLSIVEWKPVAGVIPPIGDEAWQLEFEKYQQTPEFQKVNKNMTVDDYKGIFYVEYIHRLIARFAGLIVVIPLFYFLWKGIIPWRKSAIYLVIAALFGFQGYLGWYMVSSGLTNVPAVSHFRLTIHLLMALFLLALTLWMASQSLLPLPQARSRRLPHDALYPVCAPDRCPGAADFLWWSRGRLKGRAYLQYLPLDVWLPGAAGPLIPDAALVEKSGRGGDNGPFHPPLVRCCCPDRVDYPLFSDQETQLLLHRCTAVSSG